MFATVACTSPSGSDSPASTPDEAAQAATSGESQTSTVSSRCGGSLEGCYSYTEMGEYLEAITPMVATYFEEAFADVAGPRDSVYIARGMAARGACGVSDSQAYEYCAANQTIYIGQDLLWLFYRQAGDAAPAIGLAHEWAHHLQYMLDLPAFGVASQSVRAENQPALVTGAWAGYARDQGWLEEDDDLDDAHTLLELIGSREGGGRDHGTSAERLQAFTTSYKDGTSAYSLLPALAHFLTRFSLSSERMRASRHRLLLRMRRC